MDAREIETLLDGGESDRLELKPSLAEMEKIIRTLCAFANDLPDHGKPGVLIVGLDDDGGCTNLEGTDEIEQRLTNVRSDGRILPLPVISVQRLQLRDCPVVTVEVQPAQAPPVRFSGRVYVRVGSSTRTATVADEHRLAERRRARDLPFDLRPLPSATLEDLDMDLFAAYLGTAVRAEVLEANSRSREHQLVSLRFATPDEPPVPTVLGVLSVGKDPLGYVPGAYIQFLRIEGSSLADPILDDQRLDGPISLQLQRLDDLLRINNRVAVDLTSEDREIRHADYPLAALQQLTRNAIMHRDYEISNAPVRLLWFEDRIEIHNPGGLFGQVTRETLGQPNVVDYRNPHLAEVMKNLGYVQKFGVGIAVARKELESNGNPPPDFDPSDSSFLVTVRRSAS
jgi:ATP-dependent DNA helicase RecG